MVLNGFDLYMVLALKGPISVEWEPWGDAVWGARGGALLTTNTKVANSEN